MSAHASQPLDLDALPPAVREAFMAMQTEVAGLRAPSGITADHLAPVVDRMLVHLERTGRLFMDETRAPVLDPGAGKTKTGYLWALTIACRPSRMSAQQLVSAQLDPVPLRGCFVRHRVFCAPQPEGRLDTSRRPKPSASPRSDSSCVTASIRLDSPENTARRRPPFFAGYRTVWR